MTMMLQHFKNTRALRTILAGALLTGCFAAGTLIPLPVHAQVGAGMEFPEYTFTPGSQVENAVMKGPLKDKIDEFYEEFQYMPYLRYAFFDLNGDGKNEIYAQFTEEYAYIDENMNTDTHIFANTSRGLIEVFQAQTSGIALGPRDDTGLRRIIAFENPQNTKYSVYVWDGQRRYVEQ